MDAALDFESFEDERSESFKLAVRDESEIDEVDDAESDL